MKKRTDRKLWGIERSEFLDEIVEDQYPFDDPINKILLEWRSGVERKVSKHRPGSFVSHLNDLIDECIADGYFHKNSEKGLRLNEQGRLRASFWYVPNKIWNSTQVQKTIDVLITWGVPLIAWAIVSTYFPLKIQNVPLP